MANENDEVYGKDNSSLEEGILLGDGSDRRTSVGESGSVGEALSNGRVNGPLSLEEGACVHGKINDLVADLGLASSNLGSGKRQPPSFGDCTNIRATSGPALHIEGLAVNHVKEPTQPDSKLTGAAPTAGLPTQPHNSTSTFSFKHFLNTTSSTVTAPSTTVTSLDATLSSGGGTTTTTTSSHTSQALQTSTGARPKVPQSSSVSSQSISSLAAQAAAGESSSFATKMKRSPRFSSFDSQASLAEYAGAGVGPPGAGVQRLGGSGGGYEDSLFVEPNAAAANSSSSSSFRMYPDALECGDNSVFFFGKKSSHEGGSNAQQQPVQRSVSNYDMPAPPTSPRRRLVGASSAREPRPNRLALNTSGNKLKLDLRLDSGNASGGGPPMRAAAGSNAGEFPPAVASALPDFVQDHWMDSWYAHDMHLNSQPGSPISDFFEDFASSHGGAGSAAGPISLRSVGGLPAAPHASDCREAGAMGGAAGCAASGEAPFDNEAAASNSKTLPDFLSDGPIIHSSQRLADVTVGLPANSAGSPEEPSLASQLSLLRIENERLQRELEDARVALCEQTRRADDYEWQLQEYADQASKAAAAEVAGAAARPECGGLWSGEASQQWRSGPAPAQQSHVSKLKQQIIQITTEVECLRRENEMLREEGAVGGCSSAAEVGKSERNIAKAAAAAAAARDNKKRPSKAKEISRDLLRAAANAELNLKQLLLGVDNLRQMAANIDNSEADSVKGESDEDVDLFNDVFSCGE